MISSSPPRRSWLRLLAVGMGVVLIAALFTACGSDSSDSTTSGPETASTEASEGGGDGGESVAGKTVSLVTCEPNVFCHAYNANLTDLLEAEGVEVTQLSDNFEPELQNQHMDQAIAAKPDLITVFASNADAIVPALARAQAAGIPTANVNARLGPEGEEYVTFEIVADNAALGKSAAENLVEGMEKAGYDKGRIIVVTGTMGTLIVEDRMDEFFKYMEDYPQYEVVAPEDGNWDPIETGKKTLQLLTKYRSQGGVQGAYGMADYMAAAMIQSANQLGIKSGSSPGDLVVTASNCTPTGIPLMEKGVLWGNATQSPIEESEEAAKRILEFLEGKEVPHNTTVAEERFTSENYKEFVSLCADWPS